MTTSTDKATNKQRLLSRLNSVRVEGWCLLQDFWMFMWKQKSKTVKKLDNRSHPFRVQISASFSRSELSCRRGGGAGREEPYFWWLTRPVCFSQAAPTQSPPQSVHQHTASCKSSDSESRFLTGECGLLGLWRIFPHTVSLHKSPVRRQHFSLWVHNIQQHPRYKKSSSSAWWRDTRSPWLEIRQKGMLCCRGKETKN